MKSLYNYIAESLIVEGLRLFKMNASNAQAAMSLQDTLRNFLKTTKKRYSLTDKSDLKQLFNDFVKYRGVKTEWLKEFGLINRGKPEGLPIAELLISHREELENDGWDLSCIKTFDETAREKEYKTWKSSKDYVEGHKLDRKEAEKELKNASDEELRRVLVVYDAKWPGNPDTTIQYDFIGRLSHNNHQQDHQLNMIKVDWHYLTGCPYFDARPILLSNYLAKSESELAERSFVDDSDLMMEK